jgi:hypothetical protein
VLVAAAVFDEVHMADTETETTQNRPAHPEEVRA